MPTENGRPGFLSAQTGVQIGSAALVAFAFFQGYASVKSDISNQATASALGFQAVYSQVDALKVRMETRTEDRWTKRDMKIYALQLQQLFPDKHVPIPE